MTSRWKRVATHSMRVGRVKRGKSTSTSTAGTKQRQCKVCGHRFSFWHERAPRICRPCGEIAFEIARVAGPKFVTDKAVLSARARQMLPKQVVAAATVTHR